MRRILIPEIMGQDYIDERYTSSHMLSIPERPETVIARSIPHSAIQLLDKESKRRNYVEALSIGAGIVNTYLQRLPSEEHKNLSKIRVEPEKIRGGFFGTKGMEITFERGGL